MYGGIDSHCRTENTDNVYSGGEAQCTRRPAAALGGADPSTRQLLQGSVDHDATGAISRGASHHFQTLYMYNEPYDADANVTRVTQDTGCVLRVAG